LAPPKVEVPQQQTGQTEVSLAANSQQTLKTVKPEVTKGAVSTQDLPNLSSLAPRHQPLKAKSPNLFRPHATKAPEPGASQRRSKDLTTTGGPSTNDNSAVDSTTPVKAPKAAKAAA
jgi:hypothetical protein